MNEKSVTTCRLCGGALGRTLTQKHNGLTYAYCPACEVFFQNPLRDKQENDTRYREEWERNVIDYNAKEAYRRSVARGRLRRILRARRSVKSILEVGCATGLFLDEARKQGIDGHAVELSASYAKHTREVMGFPIEERPLPEARLEKRFDAIAYFDTFEHVLDPTKEIRAIKEHLAEGGVLALAIPFLNVEFLLQREGYGQMNPDHIWLFSLNGIIRFLSQEGFRIVTPENAFAKFTTFFTRAAFIVAVQDA